MEDQERLIMAALDPSALEFYPSSSSSPQFALPFPQMYYPYPCPPPPTQLPSHYVYPPQAAANDADAASRAVVLSMVPPHVTEPLVVQSMMSFGGVRAVDLSLLPSQGTVTVHFYDLRSAQIAVADVRDQHVRQQSRLGHHLYGLLAPSPPPPPEAQQQRGLIDGQAVWAQFAAQGLDAMNQGSLFVAVSDPAVSVDSVRDIFQAFGPVMEVRESPSNPQHKFVEFFDVRDAARALNELNGKEINSSWRIFVEFNRPVLEQISRSHQHQHQHHHRRFPHQNSAPLPPRLARSNSQASSSSERGGDKIVMVKRSDARLISNVSRNRNANNSSAGKRNKGIRYSSSSRYPPPPSSSTTSESKLMSRKTWKNHGRCSAGRMLDVSRYEFKETGELDGGESAGSSSSAASSSRDSRTTVMIKNIPNKYSQKLLLNMLDNHCIHSNEKIIGDEGDEPLSAYDFVYLPIDFNNKCNVGYGFVNLTSPEATVRLHKAFHMQPWEVFNSRKICQVTYARLQGLEALKEHFKNSKLACENEEYMPAVFEPPRDGKLLTEPVPIGRQCIKIRAVGDDDKDEDDYNGGSDETGSGISEQLAQLQISSAAAS